MRGNGKGKTVIESSQSSVDNVASATFKVEANHFVAFGISIRVRITIVDIQICFPFNYVN